MGWGGALGPAGTQDQGQRPFTDLGLEPGPGRGSPRAPGASRSLVPPNGLSSQESPQPCRTTGALSRTPPPKEELSAAVCPVPPGSVHSPAVLSSWP